MMVSGADLVVVAPGEVLVPAGAVEEDGGVPEPPHALTAQE